MASYVSYVCIKCVKMKNVHLWIQIVLLFIVFSSVKCSYEGILKGRPNLKQFINKCV